MSIATDVKVATLETVVKALQVRVQALEHVQAPAPAAPPRNNAMRRAEGDRLRVAVEKVLGMHPDYSAKQVLKTLSLVDLGRQKPPSVRAIQWHITALRNAPPVLRAEPVQGG